jgi:Pectate lyase superfamily protein
MSSKAFQNADKLNGIVSVLEFGARGDGVTDDTAAIQAAIDSIEATGGTVVLGNNGKYLVASSITIKGKVCLQGSWVNPDVSGPSTAQTYSSAGSCIRLASSATIFLAQASSIENILIYRNGMTFPTESGTGYTGTALWATGNAVALRNLLVLGFNKLFYSNGQQRHTIDRVYGDNINGIEITGAYDICYVSDCHMWPFASNTNIYPSSGTSRSGIAYYAHDGADWIKFTNCFCYGYKTGFKIENANSSTLIGCSVDQNFASGSATHVDSIGFDITGTSVDTKMIGCQAGACWYGLVVNTVASETTFSDSFSAWYPKIAGIFVQQGNASISGGIIRNTDIGITTDNANSIIHVANVKFNVISNVPIYTSVSNKTIFVSECDFGNFTSTTSGAVGFGATSQVVASSDPAVIPMTGNVFRISGTTSFGSLRWGWVGREVTLIFNGSLTVFSATGSNQNMKLSGGANFAASANTSLTLKHDGVQWFETGRSA